MITFPVEFEVRGIDDACAGSPGNHFLSLSLAHLEIVVEKPSRINCHCFPAVAHILNRKIREFDFLACPIFHTRPVRSVFRRSMSATDRPGQNQHAAQQKNEARIISHAQEVASSSRMTATIRRSRSTAIYLRARSLFVAQMAQGRQATRSSHRLCPNLSCPRKTNACRNMQQKSGADLHARFCAVYLLLCRNLRAALIPSLR